MKKLIIIILLAILISHTVYAESLKVEKAVENQNINVGDDVSILLKFTNPFGQELPIKIVDKNVFGNNGIDIQCLEQTLPANKESGIKYQPIKPFAPGKYTLEPAKITYVNPETGKEETVTSNKLDVEVKGKAQQGKTQGITTIYRCNGMNMQSTSYSSSGSSFNMKIGGSNTQQSSQREGSPEKRVQNNQMNQNTNALKQQMKRQEEEQRQMKREFQRNLAANKKFRNQHEKLLKSNYNLTNASLNPVTNNTGSFKLSYKKPNGQKATLKGQMKNGTIKNMMVLTSEDRQKILGLFRKNEKFQYYDKELKKQGFNQTKPVFNQLSQNYTKISVPYQSKRDIKNITADYINGTIKNVSLKQNQKKGKGNWWWLLLLIPAVLFISWLIYKKYFKRNITQEKVVEKKEKPIDYTKEAREMVEKAKKLFAEGKRKDAYEMVSQVIRFYFSYKLNIKKEITNTELITALKRQKIKNYREIKKCLNLCGLVEFAKYRPNRKDFDEIIKTAEKILNQ